MLVICDSTKGLLFIPDDYPEPCALVSFVDFIIYPEALNGNKLSFLEYTQNDSFIPTYYLLRQSLSLIAYNPKSPESADSGDFGREKEGGMKKKSNIYTGLFEVMQ